MESEAIVERGLDRSRCPICRSPFVESVPLYDPPDGAGRRIEGRAGFVARRWQSPPLLSAREAGWILDAHRWFLTHLGDAGHALRTRLLEPVDAEFFGEAADAERARPESESETETEMETEACRARRLFEACKRHAGLSDWDCALEAREAAVVDRFAANLVLFEIDGQPVGTYRAPEDPDDPDAMPTITYDPQLVAQPEVLVAIFAHELAHGLLDGVDAEPPGGEDLEEPMTDLAAVFLGFGIFLCNAAFDFRQDFDGQWASWRTTTHGYLPEDTLAFALALFLRVHGVDPSTALAHLDPSPRRYLREALEQLDSIPDEVSALKKLLWTAPGRGG